MENKLLKTIAPLTFTLTILGCEKYNPCLTFTKIAKNLYETLVNNYD